MPTKSLHSPVSTLNKIIFVEDFRKNKIKGKENEEKFYILSTFNILQNLSYTKEARRCFLVAKVSLNFLIISHKHENTRFGS